MNNNEVIQVLNNLIATVKDGQDGYRVAAEHVSNSEFRRLFNIFSQQRAQFVTELQAEVHRLGGDPTRTGSGLSTWLHRGWTDMESVVAGGSEAAILSECQHGEESAVYNFQEALKTDLPLDIQYVVKRQYMDIKDGYDRLRILQRAA